MAVPPLILTGPPVALNARHDRTKPASAELDPAGADGGAPAESDRRSRRASCRSRLTDPFDPILATPEIERPMYEPLRDLFPRLLLPGIGGVLDNTAAMLVTNAAVRRGVSPWPQSRARARTALAWVSRPSRASPISAVSGIGVASRDKPRLCRRMCRRSTSGLAQNISVRLPKDADGQVVVLIRGELTRRYPQRDLLPGTRRRRRRRDGASPSLGTRELYPSFRGTLGADVLFFGFASSEAAVKGGPTDPGWFFVIQQPPGEPRFGHRRRCDRRAGILSTRGRCSRGRRSVCCGPPVRVAIHASCTAAMTGSAHVD